MVNAVILERSKRGELNPLSPMVADACHEGYIIEFSRENRYIKLTSRWPLGEENFSLAIADYPEFIGVPDALLVSVFITGQYSIDAIYIANFDLDDQQVKDGVQRCRIEKLILRLKAIGVVVTSLTGRFFSNFSMSRQIPDCPKTTELGIDLGSVDISYIYDDFTKNLPNVLSDSAFVTICSAGYEWGSIALLRSIRKFHDEPVFVLCAASTNKEMIKNYGMPGIYFINVPNLYISDPKKIDARYFNTLAKFYIFAVNTVRRVVYLDSDMIVYRPLQDLLDATGLDMAPLSHDNAPSLKAMAVCIMSVSTGRQKFIDLCESAKSNIKYSGRGDHGYFIHYYQNHWEIISDSFNISHKVLISDLDMMNARPHCVHYHGFKPWSDPLGPGAYLAISSAHKSWFESLSHDMLLDLNWQSREARFLKYNINQFRNL